MSRLVRLKTIEAEMVDRLKRERRKMPRILIDHWIQATRALKQQRIQEERARGIGVSHEDRGINFSSGIIVTHRKI